MPAGGHPDFAALEVLANILRSAALRPAVQGPGRDQEGRQRQRQRRHWHDPGVSECMAEVHKGDSLDTSATRCLESSSRSRREPSPKEEVDRAQQQLLKERELAAADTSRIAVQLSEWAAQGRLAAVLPVSRPAREGDADEVQAVAKSYLRREQPHARLFIPTDKPEQAEVPATPELAKLSRLQGPRGAGRRAKRSTSPENIEARSQRARCRGVKAVLLPKKTRGEAVNLRLILRYGNPDRSRATTRPLPAAAADAPRHEAPTRQQIQDELDKNKATLSASGASARRRSPSRPSGTTCRPCSDSSSRSSASRRCRPKSSTC